MKVHKYCFRDGEGSFDLELPKDAQILSVGLDTDGQSSLWALVDPSGPTHMRGFYAAYTGEPINADLGEFIGTFMRGDLICHIFATD
ncbi:MAG: DUF7352 domain-containing protein [Promethearchaeota archaeon]|jgi:hypothetical protein